MNGCREEEGGREGGGGRRGEGGRGREEEGGREGGRGGREEGGGRREGGVACTQTLFYHTVTKYNGAQGYSTCTHCGQCVIHTRTTVCDRLKMH